MNRCIGCGARRRRPRHYLCPVCWYILPPVTRLRLSEACDVKKARQRLHELYSALHRGVPLGVIEVAA